MQLRSHQSIPIPEITITFINADKKRSKITLPTTATIQDLYNLAYTRRSEKFARATPDDYQRAINLSFKGMKLTSLGTTLAASNIGNHNMVWETFKKWANAINVDADTLSITDPITLEPINGKPYLLPDCNHALERATLTQWIEQRLRDGEEPNCPCCRAVISDEHIDKLVPNRPAPPAPTAVILMTRFGIFALLPENPGVGNPMPIIFDFFPPGSPGLDDSEEEVGAGAAPGRMQR